MRSVIFSATRMRARRMTSASLLMWAARSPGPAARRPSSGSRRWRTRGENGPDDSRTISCSASAAASVPARTAEPSSAVGVPAAVNGVSARASARRARAPKTRPCRPRRASRARRSPASPGAPPRRRIGVVVEAGAHDEIDVVAPCRLDRLPTRRRASVRRARLRPAKHLADAGRAQVRSPRSRRSGRRRRPRRARRRCAPVPRGRSPAARSGARSERRRDAKMSIDERATAIAAGDGRDDRDLVAVLDRRVEVLRKRMSSSLAKMFTKRRTCPLSSQMRSLMPGYCVSRLAMSSPIVLAASR